MVGLEVEKHGDVAGERVHVLELEARELADDPGFGVDAVGGVGESAADVAGDLDRPAGRAQDRAEQLGRRGLAVRARDADERVSGQEAVAELDFAPDRDRAGTRSRSERRLRRHAGALDHELDTLQQRLLLGPEADFDTAAGKPPGVHRGRTVGGDDRHAPPGERQRGGAARAGEPEHECAPRQPRLGRG